MSYNYLLQLAHFLLLYFTMIGNCTDSKLINSLFGSVSEFARLVEINGDDFIIGNIKVIYNEEKDIHYFYEL